MGKVFILLSVVILILFVCQAYSSSCYNGYTYRCYYTYYYTYYVYYYKSSGLSGGASAGIAIAVILTVLGLCAGCIVKSRPQNQIIPISKARATVMRKRKAKTHTSNKPPFQSGSGNTHKTINAGLHSGSSHAHRTDISLPGIVAM